MRLLVTGGAGFIGSHFAGAYARNRPVDEVVVLDALTDAGDRGRVPDHEAVTFREGSVTDPDAVATAIEGVDRVVHFAARTHVDRAIADPGAFVETNVRGTQVLLDAARAADIDRLVLLSTDEVYGETLAGAQHEDDPLDPRNPYSATKAAAEHLANSYATTYGLPVLSVRPSNTYGPRQHAEKFIPTILGHALAGEPIPVYGDGSARRQWLYVDDCVRAIATVLDEGATGEAYNIGSGRELSNLELVHTVLERLGRSRDLVEFVPDRQGHDMRYDVDDTKLRQLGWEPSVDMEEGLERTIRWGRERFDE
jgi:dTDP-glucose 4,6-dehydratase